jgi:PPOX class probable F420-dependent enzyme
VARLGTAGPDAQPHLVPIVFATSPALSGATRDGPSRDLVWTAVDWKPKSPRGLRRLDNIRANPSVSVLVDEYDDADWSALWWVRADGHARLLSEPDEPAFRAAVAALAQRYAQYRAAPPPGPVIEVTVERWTGWSGEA